jgi:hypothetical protein
MRFLVAVGLVFLGIACGDGERTDVPPTSTPDKRAEYWAEVLAQQLFDPSICPELLDTAGSGGLQGGSGGFIEGDITDEIPPELLEDVSMRMMERLQEKCVAAQPSSPSN